MRVLERDEGSVDELIPSHAQWMSETDSLNKETESCALWNIMFPKRQSSMI